MRKAYPFPAYLPDQPPTGQMLSTAENVYPSNNGYGPAPSYAAQTSALPSAFTGGGAFIASDGTANLIAGTNAGLHKLTAGAWVDLAAGTAGRWRFAQFSNFVIAVNGGTTKQINLNTNTTSTLTGAPSGTSVAVVGPHVVIGQAGDKLTVAWSAFDDHTGWTPAVNQSGFQGMNDGGEVMGLAGGEYGVILQRSALTRMSLTGDPLAPFQFQQITSNFGCASKASVIQAGRTVFFLSDRGFMALEDGQSATPIGNEQVDASFRAAVSSQEYELLHTAVDPKRTLVFWALPGSPGTVWCYNWVLKRWTTLSLPLTGLFSGYTASLTLEQVAALYSNLDTMPYSLDDARFQGGDPRLYFVGTDRTVGGLTGSNLAATLAYGWQEPFGSKRARVRAVWPITDAISGVTVTLDARQRMGDTGAPIAAGNMQGSGRVPLRASGRYQRMTVQHAAGSVWTFTQGIELEAEPAGER